MNRSNRYILSNNGCGQLSIFTSLVIFISSSHCYVFFRSWSTVLSVSNILSLLATGASSAMIGVVNSTSPGCSSSSSSSKPHRRLSFSNVGKKYLQRENHTWNYYVYKTRCYCFIHDIILQILSCSAFFCYEHLKWYVRSLFMWLLLAYNIGDSQNFLSGDNIHWMEKNWLLHSSNKLLSDLALKSSALTEVGPILFCLEAYWCVLMLSYGLTDSQHHQSVGHSLCRISGGLSFWCSLSTLLDGRNYDLLWKKK